MKWITSELSVYQIDLKDEWIAYGLEAFPGRTFYKNAGISRRNGLEIFTHFFPEEKVSTLVSLTFASHNYVSYQVGNQNYAGNWVPGFAPFQMFTEVRAQLNKSIFISTNLRSLAKQFVSDNNQIFVPGYLLSGIRCQYSQPLKTIGLEVIGGVNNLFNVKYFGNIRMNAAANRFFEPAAGRTIYLGLRFVFKGKGQDGR
jgi:iron complex outermembrane receptor protein